MIDYLKKRLEACDQVVDATLTLQGTSSTSYGRLIAADEAGIVFVNEVNSTSAIPWSSVKKLTFPE